MISKANNTPDKLSWTPNTTLEALCPMMVEADLRRAGVEKGVSF